MQIGLQSISLEKDQGPQEDFQTKAKTLIQTGLLPVMYITIKSAPWRYTVGMQRSKIDI